MFHVKHSAFPRAHSLCAVVIGERTKPPRMCARIKDFFGIAICHSFDNAHLPSNALEGPYKGSVRQPPRRALETNLGNWDFFRNPRTFRVTLCVSLVHNDNALGGKNGSNDWLHDPTARPDERLPRRTESQLLLLRVRTLPLPLWGGLRSRLWGVTTRGGRGNPPPFRLALPQQSRCE